MTTVWFIRHGESISNANLPTKHPELSELTEKGHEQAKQIVKAFNQKPDLIVVSPYVRARQTAVPTITHFAPITVEEWPVFEFTYLHPERYNGTRGSDRGPIARAYWQRNDPFEKEMGGGESFAELMERNLELIKRLHKHSANFIAVFSHGLFLRALTWMLLSDQRKPNEDAMRRYSNFVQSMRMPNGSILKATFDGSQPVPIAGFDTNHLD
ncbi:MAG: histidine phosphatase family protein [Chloroflexi bacterium]|nr:MAG: histidine phosphatase family protein [Chloroflexota bacterium]